MGALPAHRVTSAAAEVHRLRQWLHRIEEACNSKAPSTARTEIRDAALAALRGAQAPARCGQLHREG